MLKTQSCDHVQYLHNYQFHNMHNLLNLEFSNHSSSNWEFHPAHSTKHNPSMHLLWKGYQKSSSYLKIKRRILKQSWAVVMDSLLTISWNWHQCNNLFHFNIICDFIFETTSIMTTSAFIEIKIFDQFSQKLCDKIVYMKFLMIFISGLSMATMWNLIFGYVHD